MKAKKDAERVENKKNKSPVAAQALLYLRDTNPTRINGDDVTPAIPHAAGIPTVTQQEEYDSDDDKASEDGSGPMYWDNREKILRHNICCDSR